MDMEKTYKLRSALGFSVAVAFAYTLLTYLLPVPGRHLLTLSHRHFSVSVAVLIR